MKKAIAFIIVVLIIIGGVIGFMIYDAVKAEQSRQEYQQKQQQLKLDMQPYIDSAVENCSLVEDSYDQALCLAHSASKFMIENDTDFTEEICNNTEEDEACLFFAAKLAHDQGPCWDTDLRVGCQLLMDDAICDYVENKVDCLHTRALLYSFYDSKSAEIICKRVVEAGGSCDDIEISKSVDELPQDDRLLTLYIALKLGDIRLERIR
ncbi:hypothetical protein KY330_04990 [Candidatus Woesearchaeota archaeon]|nr:hypothetical protein [Candidatus Woesearchaeota archaeon]